MPKPDSTQDANQPSAPSRRLTWVALPLLFVVSYAVFAPSFGSPWLMDDRKVIVNNPDVRSLESFVDDHYPGRPLRELSYVLDFKLFGYEPGPWHIQQIFWHALCGWLLILVALALGAPWPVALGAPLVFLLHPIQVEAVANISHRKDSLALAFSLLSLLAYLRGRSIRGPLRWAALAGATLLWGVACFGKQNAVALIAVVGALELRQLPDRYRNRVAWSVFATGLLGTLARLIQMTSDNSFLSSIRPSLLKIGYWGDATVNTYFLTMLKSWALMASKLLVPVDLAMEYTFSPPTSWLDPWVLAGILLAATALAGLVLSFSRQLTLFAAVVWTAAFWLPTSNLLGKLAYFAADRYLYAPLAGISLLVAWGGWRLLAHRTHGSRVYWAAALILAVGLGALSVRQQGFWQDGETFFSHMLDVSPDAHEGLVGLGYVAQQQGNIEEARAYLESASKTGIEDAWVLANLGAVYDELGLTTQAEGTLKQALQIDPHLQTAYTNLGALYERTNRLSEAEQMHRRAVKELPGYAIGHYNLGVVLYRLGRNAESFEQFAQALAVMPNDPSTINNWGTVALELGKKDVAQTALTRLQTLDPELARELESEIRAHDAR